MYGNGRRSSLVLVLSDVTACVRIQPLAAASGCINIHRRVLGRRVVSACLLLAITSTFPLHCRLSRTQYVGYHWLCAVTAVARVSFAVRCRHWANVELRFYRR